VACRGAGRFVFYPGKNMPPANPEHCRSCAAPLANPDFHGPREHYCKYCVAPDGEVKSRTETRDGIRQWMIQAWQLPEDDPTLERRLDDYMNAMPHWGR